MDGSTKYILNLFVNKCSSTDKQGRGSGRGIKRQPRMKVRMKKKTALKMETTGGSSPPANRAQSATRRTITYSYRRRAGSRTNRIRRGDKYT